MDVSFAGFLAYPLHFNNIGVILLDSEQDRKGLIIRLASVGCMAMQVDISVYSVVDGPFDYIYRYAEKILLIGFARESSVSVTIANANPDIDGLILFNPNVGIKEPRSSLIYKVFSQESTGDAVSYIPEDLEQIGDASRVNNLWEELDKIVQFI